MNNEFKKTAKKNQTVYTLENASAGGTSAGSIASVSSPMGGVQKRGQIVTSSTEKKVPATTPRNFVAKNAKTGGAGAHKDKKKAEKQGTAKHKKPYMEALQAQLDQLKSKVEEGVAETLPMPDAVKLLRQYGADHFKTTSNELHFYKNGRHLSVDLVMNPDTTRSVSLSSLNAATRGLKGQGVAEGWKDKVGAAALAGSMAMGGGAAQAGNWADAAARGLYHGMTGSVAGSAIHKEKNAADMAFADKIPDEADKAQYIKAVKSIIRSRDNSVMRHLGSNATATRGSITVDERRFNRLKTELSQKYNIPLDQVKEQGVAEGSGRPSKKDAVIMAYLNTVSNSPTGTPDEDFLTDWQYTLEEEFGIEMDTAVLANLLPQLDSQVEMLMNKYTKTMNNLGMYESEQGVAEDGSVTHKGGEVSRKDGVTKHKAGPGVYGGYDASRHPDSPEEKHVGPRGAKAGHSSDKITKHKSAAEGFNGEYDDEAGMAESNLHTMARAVKGLMDTIDSNDNLPEWCQEKIAKAEMMVTGVWDYLLSQKEQGIDPAQGVAENYPKHQDLSGISTDKLKAYLAKQGQQQSSGEGNQVKRVRAELQRREQGVAEGDAYMESLQAMVERQLEPTMDLDAWNDNFQNADPQKYHQFKNKSPEKKK